VSNLPTVDEVLQLPAVREGVVPPEYLDENDHMNIGRYLEEASLGLWHRTIGMGMGPEYIEERRQTTFTAEHHLTYLSELRLGDAISVHVRFLERSDKVLHTLTFIVDRTHGRLAATVEATLIHMNFDTRRPEPFPDDVLPEIDVEVERSEALGWAAPVCGVMGVRRR
jgi:acyl-CoA thioester hydrolase